MRVKQKVRPARSGISIVNKPCGVEIASQNHENLSHIGALIFFIGHREFTEGLVQTLTNT